MNLVEPYDKDTYAAAFFPVAEELEAQAAEAEQRDDRVSALDLYLYNQTPRFDMIQVLTAWQTSGCPVPHRPLPYQ